VNALAQRAVTRRAALDLIDWLGHQGVDFSPLRHLGDAEDVVAFWMGPRRAPHDPGGHEDDRATGGDE